MLHVRCSWFEKKRELPQNNTRSLAYECSRLSHHCFVCFFRFLFYNINNIKQKKCVIISQLRLRTLISHTCSENVYIRTIYSTSDSSKTLNKQAANKSTIRYIDKGKRYMTSDLIYDPTLQDYSPASRCDCTR